jgi:CRP/FNR family transcriptional regulator, cyclic AMP receptor protein
MDSPRRAHSYREILRADHWYRSLPEPFASRLLDAATVRELPARATLFARGDAPTGLHAVVTGAVRVVRLTDEGDEIMQRVAEPPIWFGEVELIDGEPPTLHVIAERDATVVHVPLAALERLLEDDPRMWREVARLAVRRLRLATAVLEDLATSPPEVRLARRILMINGGYGDWHERKLRAIDVRQAQLASMVSVSRQTLNQLLKDLEARGVLALAYGRIEVVDETALREIARLEER